jgi:hypothetical protein
MTLTSLKAERLLRPGLATGSEESNWIEPNGIHSLHSR